MKFLHKYGTRSSEIRRARRELYLRLALVVAVILFFTFMLILTKFRPQLDEEESSRLPTTANIGDPMDNPQLVRLRAEIEAIADAFHESLIANSIDLEDLESLEEAIDKQRAVIRFRGSEIAPRQDLERLEELLTLYDEQMGEFLIAQSRRLEEEAERLMNVGRQETALETLVRARNLQNEINEQYPRASARDSTRLHRLNNTILSWQTKPAADKADRLRKEAFELVEAGRYEEARARMEEALQTQQTLNEEHRQSRYASLSRLRQFEQAWQQVQAAEDADTVERLMAEAQVALNTEQTELALSRAEEAEVLQQRIMARFPGLELARPEILSRIVRVRDTASSLPAYQEIEAMREDVHELLRQRRMETFKNSVSEWLRATQSFLRSYPQSLFADEIDEREVRFLHDMREEIPTLLETIYANLVAIPGHGGFFLYRTEVPQVLFSRVTGRNPSVNKAPQLPVDSVTWEEAVEFVQELEWILARPVSLPDRNLFLAALGNMEPEELDERAWSSQNANRETRPVGSTKPNDLGFHDLLGNVSEWLDADRENPPDRVVAIGGSARDNALRLASIPEESRSPTERNRFVGFRFAVRMVD